MARSFIKVRSISDLLLKCACDHKKASMNENRDVRVRHLRLLCDDGA
jgi:hypothetical protein